VITDDPACLAGISALRIFNAARPPKDFISLPGAGRLLTQDERDAACVAEIIMAWVHRCSKP
jgi:hypothetical protein